MIDDTLCMKNKVNKHFNNKKLDDNIFKKLEKLDYIINLYNDTETVEFYEEGKKYLLYVINTAQDYETGEKLFEILYKRFTELVIKYEETSYVNTYEKKVLSLVHPYYVTIDPDTYNDLVYKYNQLFEDYDDIINKYNELAKKHTKLIENFFNEKNIK